jgi:hypothetical protein
MVDMGLLASASMRSRDIPRLVEAGLRPGVREEEGVGLRPGVRAEEGGGARPGPGFLGEERPRLGLGRGRGRRRGEDVVSPA